MLEEKIYEIYNRIKFSEEVIPLRNISDAGHRSYLKKCTDKVTVDGLWLEFGVYRGRTICNISENTNKIVYGFDSFEGLHEHWDSDNPKGIYSLNGRIPEGAICGEDWEVPYKMRPWPENVKLIQGYFGDTLPQFLVEHTGPIAFLHIDSDLYSSARYVLDTLAERIVPGTVIVFDEYFNFPGWQQDEFRAWQEFVAKKRIKYEYLGFVSGHQEVAIKVTKIS